MMRILSPVAIAIVMMVNVNVQYAKCFEHQGMAKYYTQWEQGVEHRYQ